MSDRAVVEHVARLTRLALEEAQVDPLAEQLGAILGYVERLQDGDSAPSVTADNRFRPVGLRIQLDQAARLRNAAESEDGAFSVPAVL